MSDLLAEVDEMMRQERVVKLWKDHGGTLIAVIVAIIIGTGAFSGYNAWNAGVKSKGTDQLLNLLEHPDFPQNIDNSTFEMRTELEAIALITAAARKIEEGKNEEALSLYEEAASNSKTPDDFRELALLHIARLSQKSVEDRQADLAPIWNNENSPWRYHAHLEAATLFAHNGQNYAKAIEHLDIIQSAANLPETLYNKARALSQIYTLEQAR